MGVFVPEEVGVQLFKAGEAAQIRIEESVRHSEHRNIKIYYPQLKSIFLTLLLDGVQNRSKRSI